VEETLASRENPGRDRNRKPVWLKEYEKGYSQMKGLVSARLAKRPYFVWHEGTLPAVRGDGYGSEAESRLPLAPESSGKRWAAGYLYAPTGTKIALSVGSSPSVLAESHDQNWAEGSAREASRRWPALRRRLEESEGFGLALSVVLVPFLEGQYPLSPRNRYQSSQSTPSLAKAKKSFETWALAGAKKSELTTNPYYWTGGLRIAVIPPPDRQTPMEAMADIGKRVHEHGVSWPPYYGQGNWVFPHDRSRN
jgi:hypothetical protein